MSQSPGAVRSTKLKTHYYQNRFAEIQRNISRVGFGNYRVDGKHGFSSDKNYLSGAVETFGLISGYLNEKTSEDAKASGSFENFLRKLHHEVTMRFFETYKSVPNVLVSSKLFIDTILNSDTGFTFVIKILVQQINEKYQQNEKLHANNLGIWRKQLIDMINTLHQFVQYYYFQALGVEDGKKQVVKWLENLLLALESVDPAIPAQKLNDEWFVAEYKSVQSAISSSEAFMSPYVGLSAGEVSWHEEADVCQTFIDYIQNDALQLNRSSDFTTPQDKNNFLANLFSQLEAQLRKILQPNNYTNALDGDGALKQKVSHFLNNYVLEYLTKLFENICETSDSENVSGYQQRAIEMIASVKLFPTPAVNIPYLVRIGSAYGQFQRKHPPKIVENVELSAPVVETMSMEEFMARDEKRPNTSRLSMSGEPIGSAVQYHVGIGAARAILTTINHSTDAKQAVDSGSLKSLASTLAAIMTTSLGQINSLEPWGCLNDERVNHFFQVEILNTLKGVLNQVAQTGESGVLSDIYVSCNKIFRAFYDKVDANTTKIVDGLRDHYKAFTAQCREVAARKKSAAAIAQPADGVVVTNGLHSRLPGVSEQPSFNRAAIPADPRPVVLASPLAQAMVR